MPTLRSLPRSFYTRPTLTVARALLGCLFVRRLNGVRLILRIVEVEAYTQKDPASHTYRGRTPRNEVMYLSGGHLYVYFTYGMHYCANVVSGPAGRGEAVLIRAGEPLEGTELMRRNRGRDGFDLTNGPAKLCQALGLGRGENGTDLTGDTIFVSRGVRIPPSVMGRSGRIGITTATEKRWRFFVRGNPWVSK